MAIAFFLTPFSLAGVPPLSGFFAKFVIVRAGIEAEAYWVTAVALLVGLMTLYSMVKVWNEVFWKPLPEENLVPVEEVNVGDDSRMVPPSLALMYLPVAMLALFTLLIGIFAEPLMGIMNHIGDQLMAPQRYIEAVLGTEAGVEGALSREETP